MKRFLLVGLSLFSFTTVSFAGEKEVCEKLFDRAWKNCSDYMCVDAGMRKGCEIDSDGMEGVQICVTEGELESLIKAYNVKNPRAKVKCEDI